MFVFTSISLYISFFCILSSYITSRVAHNGKLMQNLQDEMMDLMDVSNEIQETLGRSYSVPDDIDEEELMGGKLMCQIQI